MIMFMQKIYDSIDKWSLKSGKKTAPNVETYVQERSIKNIDEKLSHSFDVINSNVSALLTHISAMIAVSAIMLIVFDKNSITQTFIAFEMLGYCVAAFLCLANLPYTHLTPMLKKNMSFDPSNKWDLYIGRRYLYVFTAYLVGFLTICLSMTILGRIIMGALF